MDPMTPEEERITKGFTEILFNAMPPDMDPQKVEARSAIIASIVGTTRTSIMGAVMFAAFYSKFTGLSTEQIKEVFDKVDVLLKDSPLVAEGIEKYNKMNMAAKEAEKKSELSGAVIISPGNDKVH